MFEYNVAALKDLSKHLSQPYNQI